MLFRSVIHSVVTLRNNAAFTRIECAGLVDADGHDENDRANLAAKGIQVLPVSEIENLLLLPNVSHAILEMNYLEGDELEQKLVDLQDAIFADAAVERNVNEVVLGYCRRRIDRLLKQIDFSTNNSVLDLASNYTAKTAEVDIPDIASQIRAKITTAVSTRDLAALLAVYDRKKPLLAIASSRLCNLKVEVFSAWTTRAIQSPNDDRLRLAISSVLPTLTPA